MEYKVIKSIFPELEKTLNTLVSDGWRATAMTSAVEWEIVVILERRK
jgi:hypothetical protein